VDQVIQTAPPRDGRWRLLVGVLAATPLLLGAAVDAAGGWIPMGDEATIVLRARDVFSSHTPLLGQFSEATAYLPHGQYLFAPGPSLYWLLAVPAQVAGRWPWAPLVWSAAVEAGVVVGIVWLAGQLGGRLLAVGTALGIVLLTASVGARNLYTPWNVHLPVLPLVLLVFVAWAMLEGSHRLLPLAALIVGFEVQADPSFGFVSVALSCVIVVAFGRAWWRARHRPARERRDAGLGWPTLVLAAAVSAALWLPALVQQLTTNPGNLTLLARSSRRQGRREGVVFGLSILGKAATHWPSLELHKVPLSAGSGAPLSYSLAGVAVLVLLGALLVIARQHGSTREGSGLVAVLAASVGLVLAAALLPADWLTSTSLWLLGWSPAVGMLVWIVVGWSAWSLWANRPAAVRAPAPVRRATSWLVASGVVVVTAATAANVGYLIAQPDPDKPWYPVIRTVAADLEAQPHPKPYAVGARMTPTVPLLVGQGLLLRLASKGVPVGANDGFERNLGMHYRLPRNDSVPTVVIYGDYNRYGFTAATPRGGRVLASMPVDLYEYGKRVVVHVVLVPAGATITPR
jgi:hypothetical protein